MKLTAKLCTFSLEINSDLKFVKFNFHIKISMENCLGRLSFYTALENNTIFL